MAEQFFEIYGNFEVKLFSALGIETIEIDVLRTIESNLQDLKGIRNRDTESRVCSRILHIVLRKEHLTASTAPHLKCIYRTREESRNQ